MHFASWLGSILVEESATELIKIIDKGMGEETHRWLDTSWRDCKRMIEKADDVAEDIVGNIPYLSLGPIATQMG